MRKLTLTVLALAALVLAAILTAPQSFADEKNLGKHSPDEIKDACNKAGGELLGFSDLGSYGCEVSSKGTMVLCNKNQECTGYTPAMTRSQHLKILNSLKLTEKAAVATTGTGAPKRPASTHTAPVKPNN
jgi:hypothetical protein